jgi:hypothetical protein
MRVPGPILATRMFHELSIISSSSSGVRESSFGMGMQGYLEQMVRG